MRFLKINVSIIMVLVIITIVAMPSYAENITYVWSTNSQSVETVSESNNSLNLESGAGVLIEQKTGKVLYEHNMHEQLRPASVTKIMSILLIMEEINAGNLSYDDKISCSETAKAMGGSQIWLDTTETLTVNEMLKAICVVSAND